MASYSVAIRTLPINNVSVLLGVFQRLHVGRISAGVSDGGPGDGLEQAEHRRRHVERECHQGTSQQGSGGESYDNRINR